MLTGKSITMLARGNMLPGRYAYSVCFGPRVRQSLGAGGPQAAPGCAREKVKQQTGVLLDLF